MDDLDLDALVTRHTVLTDDLAQRLRELGDTRSAIVLNQAAVWNDTQHLSVTERREQVRHYSAQLIADTETQLGEIDALHAEIANTELRIRAMGV